MSVADLKASGSGVISCAVNSVWQMSGVAQIDAGQGSEAVADANITANSVVVATLQGVVADATLLYVARVGLIPGGGFTIIGNAPATANTLVSWAVLKY
jgi:hypothetical protein